LQAETNVSEGYTASIFRVEMGMFRNWPGYKRHIARNVIAKNEGME
jgi:hypothetical protein